jgi:hypothetical protein
VAHGRLQILEGCECIGGAIVAGEREHFFDPKGQGHGQVWAQGFYWLEAVLQVCGHNLGHGGASEGPLECECLIKNTAQGVKIGAPIERVAAELLGRHHVNRADDRPGVVYRLEGGFGHGAGLPEIKQLDAVATIRLGLEHDVAGFDIAVDDIFFVSGAEA